MMGKFLLLFAFFITLTNPTLATCPSEEDAIAAFRSKGIKQGTSFHFPSNGKLWNVTGISLHGHSEAFILSTLANKDDFYVHMEPFPSGCWVIFRTRVLIPPHNDTVLVGGRAIPVEDVNG